MTKTVRYTGGFHVCECEFCLCATIVNGTCRSCGFCLHTHILPETPKTFKEKSEN